jgi:serine/threonine protein kinase
MNLSLIATMLINKDDLQTLLDIHDAARRLDSEDRSSPSKGFYSRSYRKLAEAAKLRAKTKTDPHIKKRLVRPPAVLHKRDYEIFHGNGRELYWSRGNAYLAYCQRDRSMVIIEYKHYRSPELSGHTQKVHKEHILMWAEFLCADEKPSSIRMLDCTGYFHDEAEGGYGFVYELPSYMYLKHPDQLRIPGTLTLRAPTDLFMLMRNKTEPISLATRVRIAQQLATSLYMIHSCGLTHQNIRPTSILFLPAESSDGTGPSRQRRCALGKPYFMGWLFDEPEDLLAEDMIGLNRAAVAMKSREYMVYQHPDTIRYYNRPYLPQYDIYSLGLILLEIGTWQNMYDQTNTSGLLSAQDLSDYVMANYVPMLAETTGKIYVEAVRKCLDVTDRVKNMSRSNGKPSSEDQMLVAKMFLRDIVSQLDKIRV